MRLAVGSAPHAQRPVSHALPAPPPRRARPRRARRQVPPAKLRRRSVQLISTPKRRPSHMPVQSVELPTQLPVLQPPPSGIVTVGRQRMGVQRLVNRRGLANDRNSQPGELRDNVDLSADPQSRIFSPCRMRVKASPQRFRLPGVATRRRRTPPRRLNDRRGGVLSWSVVGPEHALEFQTRNVTHRYGPDRLIIGSFCAIAASLHSW